MTATHALLLTDVVDSTKLAEALGDAAMADLWTRHDRVARDLLPAHGGREIDKTDGFLLLFDRAPEAVAYALAYHRALRALGLKARAGLHVGPVILRENPADDVARGAKPLEVEGLAKPTAARVMGLASGGQTLLTPEAREDLGPTSLRVESHGHWRMKGVSEPIELFEVGDADAPFTPPPDAAKVYRVVRQGASPGEAAWSPVKEVPHNLPRQRDAFVGREADLQALAGHLDDGVALITVLGTGGTGKTRFVTHYGWTWLGDWPGGVWFCDLSEARDRGGVLQAVARALDVPLGKDTAEVQLGHAIAGRGKCLVILDNFEQVARHAEETLGRWLDRALQAQFVVTSREVLGLPGETTLALAPLPGPDAASLFVARATQAKRDVGLTEADRPEIEALVRLLDGLPLAIELAAARIRTMPLRTLRERMTERFKLLASSGGRPTRQATLRGALDWSWELLSPDEQRGLAQLSVFEGGFTLEAAEAVLALDDAWPPDLVQALADKSLVRVAADGRFDLLVTVQQYAAEKRAGLDPQGAERRHGAWYATFGTTEALEALGRHGGVALRWALARELDNLAAASRRAAARGDGPVAAATALAAWAALRLRGPASVGEALLSGARDAADLAPEVAARLDLALGQAARLAGRMDDAAAAFERARRGADRQTEGHAQTQLGTLHRLSGHMDEARSHLERGLALAREVGDRRGAARALDQLGSLHVEQGRPVDAAACLREALAVHQERGDRASEADSLVSLGIVHATQGRAPEARPLYEQALAAYREVGDRRDEANVLANLGSLHVGQGRMAEARVALEQALAVVRDVGDRRIERTVLFTLGSLHRQQGRLDDARPHYQQALAVARQDGDLRTQGIILGHLADLHRGVGRLDEAAADYEAALALHRETGNRRFEGIVSSQLGQVDALRGRPDEARSRYALALALAREVGDRVLEGSIQGRLAALHLGAGATDDADACLDAGEALLRSASNPVELGMVLGLRARVARAAGLADRARAALLEAEAIAHRADAGPESDLGQALAAARAALAAGPGLSAPPTPTTPTTR